MRQKYKSRALVRSTGIIMAVLAIVGGVTFATLQSQAAVMKGNTIQTALASLQVSQDDTNFSSSLTGYAFTNMIPGGQPTPMNGYPVYVENAGTSSLALKLSVASTLVNHDNVDLSKVHIILSPVGSGTGLNATLQDLMTANTTGGIAVPQNNRLIPGQISNFTLRVSMDSDAVSGPSATIDSLDLVFDAAAVN